jgi:hypothetical protein
MKVTHAAHLSNSELIREVSRLAGDEREATVALIVHLAEFDARRLYAEAGFRSTFQYCVEVLHLSEDAAFNRIRAARAARRHPIVLEMLSTGSLSPTTARMLAPHLTPGNHAELLAAAAGKGKKDVERVLARFFPQPDVPSSVRKARSGATSLQPMAKALRASTDAGAKATPAAVGVAQPPAASMATFADPVASAAAPSTPVFRSREVVRPLSAERYEIRFTASAETREKLRQAQDLLGHAVPSGDLAQVFDRALTLLVEDLRRKKFKITNRPRRSRGQSADSRNIPADAARAVAERDGERCAYVAPSGHRCGERRAVEFDHHVVPFAVGGKPTTTNLQLLCRAHNKYEADAFYGPMREYVPVPEPLAAVPPRAEGESQERTP